LEGLEGLRAICSAPGKVILFGEHAVVYGHPAIAAATDQRTRVEVDVCGDRFTVNGFRLNERHHAYLLQAVDHCWHRQDPVRLQTEGGVPSASGTGSSAALTVAAVAALLRLQGDDGRARVAQESFGVERLTQGGGSPVDTSTSTAGGGIAIASRDAPAGVGKALWDVTWEDRAWTVERVALPELTVVVGNSGVKGRTGEQVAKVAHAMRRNALVRDALGELGQIARDAVPALRRDDRVAVGALMDKAHAALYTLGVNHVAVQRLVDAAKASPGVLGAKLTGAGGGGSMVALTEDPERTAKAIEDVGGRAYVIRLGGPGLRWSKALAPA